MAENPVALLLWAVGLALFLWKPQTEGPHLVMCGAGTALWGALAIWLPALRSWPFMLLIAFFGTMSLFRFMQHR
jgi:hypothetical protein